MYEAGRARYISVESGSPKENGLLRELNGILRDGCLKPEIVTLDRTLTNKPIVQRGPPRARRPGLDSTGQ
jgi:hypothetical protein